MAERQGLVAQRVFKTRKAAQPVAGSVRLRRRSVSQLTALRRPRQTYKLSLPLSVGDAGGGPVSYTLNPVDPAMLNTDVRRDG